MKPFYSRIPRRLILFISLLFFVSTLSAQNSLNKSKEIGSIQKTDLEKFNPRLRVKNSSNENVAAFKHQYNAPIQTHYENNVLKWISNCNYSISKNNSSNQALDIHSSVMEFVKSKAHLFNYNNLYLELRSNKSYQDDLGFTHLSYYQEFDGLRVWTSDLIFHVNENELKSYNGNYLLCSNFKLKSKQFHSAEAIEKVKLDLASKGKYRALTENEKKLVAHDEILFEEIIFLNPDRSIEATRAWHISIYKNIFERWEYFIDANNGTILESYKSTCADGPQTANALDLNNQNRTINTYLKSGTYFMLDASRTMFMGGTIPDDAKGAIVTLDLKNAPLASTSNLFFVSSANNTWSDKSAVSAHVNAGLCYEYFKTVHSRNSIDGAGGTIYSVVNVADDNGGGLDNAFWTGKLMCYGNGGTAFKPLAGALDVAAHEMTHGVTENTANLEYKFQSGAINESMSDVFGVALDPNDWKLGEDVVKLSAFPSGALRDIQDPHNGGTNINSPGWQPSHMNEYLNLDISQDNGGVHINSGIPNKAFYNFAVSVGMAKAEKVYYRALANYLTRSSNFIDLRNAVIQSATDLHGQNSSESQSAAAAFDAVGIQGSGGGGGGGSTQTDLNPNPGTEFMLVHDGSIPSADPNSFYIVTNPDNITNNDFHPVATINALNRPSIMDNGAVAVFAGTNKIPYALTLSISNPQLTPLDNQNNWDNIAVSKDGNRIALISKFIDTSIYVYDFNSQQLAQYVLYNPTTAPGTVNSDGPLYANAIEWDYSGEYLIYDAYNVIKKSNGQNIDYWDVGFINVWNKTSNNFGDGRITKLFSGLPEGISIGNPSISKNSPYIGAFDFLDFNNNQIKIIGVNMETGDNFEIFNNNTIGYPSYNKNDNAITFTSINNQNGDTVVAKIALQSNKIAPSGSAIGLISQAKWSSYYANGNRVINIGIEMNDPSALNIYPNPFQNNIQVDVEANGILSANIDVYDMLGSKLKSITINDKTNTINLSDLTQGTYLLRIINGNKIITKKIIKTN